MTHFGIFCPSETGHLNTMITLGRELQRRGHRVTAFQVPDAQIPIQSAGLDCSVIGQTQFPLGAMIQQRTKLGQLSGIAGMRYAIEMEKQKTAVTLAEGPRAVHDAGVDVLLVDQASRGGGTVADRVGIPFISVCSALMLNREMSVPPIFMSWGYDPSRLAYVRNCIAYFISLGFIQPIHALVNEHRRQWNLPLYKSPDDYYSQIAQICQQPAEFEFPRSNLPDNFYFTGPLTDPSARDAIPFPYDQLTGQPLIYASMGTLLNRKREVFQLIARACAGLEAQLVISLGGSLDPESLPNLSGSPIVVRYAPQLELLKQARLTITHAGLNTTMESLSNGVPLVAIPITIDQPGVAARIAWTGTGEFIDLNRLNPTRLRLAIARVLTNPSYRHNALRLQEAIRRSGGVHRAVDIIEQVLHLERTPLESTPSHVH
ncbi:MAG: glycosyltransferase [Elainellaceae cyanobacterium]